MTVALDLKSLQYTAWTDYMKAYDAMPYTWIYLYQNDPKEIH